MAKQKTKKKQNIKSKQKKQTHKHMRVNRSKFNQKPIQKTKRKPFKPSLSNSYSPFMNKYITHENTLTKRTDFHSCKNDEIRVKEYKYTCMSIYSKPAKQQMLRLLNRKRIARKITAPQQKLSNCWFNTMFMCFFISDKGYKFTKMLRQCMIMGTRMDGSQISDSLKHVFLQLNTTIQASMNGVKDDYYLLKDTNQLISSLAKYYPSTYQVEEVTNVGEYGNPLVAYSVMIQYLLNEKNRKVHLVDVFSDTFEKLKKGKLHIRQDILAVHLDLDKEHVEKPLEIRDSRNRLWRLDSIVISNEEHFICFLTIHQKEYGFDGGSYQKLQSFQWKDYINRDRNFNLENKSITNWSFNFSKGYQILLYYRIR